MIGVGLFRLIFNKIVIELTFNLSEHFIQFVPFFVLLNILDLSFKISNLSVSVHLQFIVSHSLDFIVSMEFVDALVCFLDNGYYFLKGFVGLMRALLGFEN